MRIAVKSATTKSEIKEREREWERRREQDVVDEKDKKKIWSLINEINEERERARGAKLNLVSVHSLNNMCFFCVGDLFKILRAT